MSGSIPSGLLQLLTDPFDVLAGTLAEVEEASDVLVVPLHRGEGNLRGVIHNMIYGVLSTLVQDTVYCTPVQYLKCKQQILN